MTRTITFEIPEESDRNALLLTLLTLVTIQAGHLDERAKRWESGPDPQGFFAAMAKADREESERLNVMLPGIRRAYYRGELP